MLNIAYFIKPKNTVAFVYSDSTLRQTIEKMKHHGYSAIPVLSHEGMYVGTVTEGDLLYASYGKNIDELEKIGLTAVLKEARAKTVSILATEDEVISVLREQNFVPVVDDRGCFMGIVTRRDILTFFSKEYHRQQNSQNSIN